MDLARDVARVAAISREAQKAQFSQVAAIDLSAAGTNRASTRCTTHAMFEAIRFDIRPLYDLLVDFAHARVSGVGACVLP